MKRILFFCIVVCLATSLSAQDFRCQISVNSSQIAGSNRSRYDALRDAMYNFVNERKWCTYTLKANERIECVMNLNIKSVSGDVISGEMLIQLQRPVYRASYKTTVLNFQDKNVQFKYEEGAPLEYSETANLSQLTSFLAFYLNLFLAIDFDTFSLNGGSEYYSKCQNIVSLCQSATESGWKPYEQGGQTNRYWLLENLTNGQYNKIHEFLYNYHRLGLDIMAETPDAGRAAIAESLRILQNVNSQKPNLYIVRVILQAKSDEIINIFKEGLPGEKTQVINIMKQLDPSNINKYDAINAQQ